MLVAVWIVFLLVMLFLLGSAVGSFLNVCIVRLPQGRSLVRPASCCGQCGKPIRIQDNIPLLSYWLLRGRCRVCGAAFSMRYFWIELLTGFIFVLIYYLEIGRNVHHFQLLSGYENDYESLLVEMFRPPPWLVFAVHALLSCLLIVATMTYHEAHKVPRSVTIWGVLLGLLAAGLFPWPWPDEATQAVAPPAAILPRSQALLGNASLRSSASRPAAGQEAKQSFAEGVPKQSLGTRNGWGPRLGAMPADAPWWLGDVTPRAGLYPWPVWGPLPDWLPPGSCRLGMATGLAGVLTGALLMALVRLAFNFGAGAAAIGWGETSLLLIAGGFLGWQPILVAGLLGLVPGLIAATRQWKVGKRIEFSMWLALAVVGVWLGWYWIGPLMQGLFFNPARLLLCGVLGLASLLGFVACFRLLAAARPKTGT